ncbi:hypothetical protein V6N13_122761 [Hibiscus sabdariffa]
MDSRPGGFGMAAVLRDESGLVIGGVSNMSSSSSNALAEALALRLADILYESLEFDSCSFTYVYKDCNVVAIWVARNTRSGSCPND